MARWKYKTSILDINTVIPPNAILCDESGNCVVDGIPGGLETLKDIWELAKANGMNVHCDGARLFNAVVATGTPAAEYARYADTVTFCLSKALGCPLGSVLCGPAEVIEKAHRFRKMLGGGMRQVGIVAAAGLHALEHHIDRLADDHARAQRFRAGIEGTPGLALPMPSPTNMVFVEVADARAFAAKLTERGVKVLATGPTRVRTVFHLDIDDAGVDQAVEAFKSVAASTP